MNLTKHTDSNNKMSPDAAVRSLRLAILSTRDYSSACSSIRNRLRRLPKEPLHIDHQHGGVFFYTNGKYLRKNSDLLYSLARKRYCESLLHVITLISKLPAATAQRGPLHSEQCAPAFAALDRLIHDFAEGNLILERILFTKQQYAWYVGQYQKKAFYENHDRQPLLIPQGGSVRSKSEQNIGIALWDLFVPCHYEELLQINVQRLVGALQSDLRERGQLNRPLFYYQGGSCYWNVPEEMQWMNAPGSIWRTYDARAGCLRIYPDYTIMLADSRLLFWEHEGLLGSFLYRANAMERVCVMQLAGGIPRENVIETFEAEANDREVLERIIQNRILPRLWF